MKPRSQSQITSDESPARLSRQPHIGLCSWALCRGPTVITYSVLGVLYYTYSRIYPILSAKAPILLGLPVPQQQKKMYRTTL